MKVWRRTGKWYGCIIRALDTGTREELEAQYDPLTAEAPGFALKNTGPHILVKTK